MKAQMFFKIFISVLMVTTLIYHNNTLAQPAPIPYHVEAYSLYSGTHDGRAGEAYLAYTATVQAEEAPWLRLKFSEVNLGNNSYLIITSLKDEAWQRLDAPGIFQWGNTSAYFNGDAVSIEMFVAPGDIGVFIQLAEIMVGDPPEENGTESICGTEDNRITSNHPAAGRLVPGGCSGWINSNGLQVTAGHCFALAAMDVLEFNVPSSLPNGTIQHPGPEDQYSVADNSVTYVYGGIGNDWGVFSVFDNSNTGLQPIEAQGASFTSVQDLTPPNIRVTGYGVDGPPPGFGTGPRNSDSQTQQTHMGSNQGSSGTTLRYAVDTQGGNSGSPVIDKGTGNAIGVHTHGGCNTYGYNSGTSTFNTVFWEALSGEFTVTVDQKLNNETSVDSIAHWENNDFVKYAVPKEFTFTTGTIEVLRGAQKVISNQKYNRWNNLPDVTNHHVFSINQYTLTLISRFEPAYSNAVIKNHLLSAPTQNGGIVEFKDPWLIDYPDPAYGNNLRNRGMKDSGPDALRFWTRSSPFNPDYDTPFGQEGYKYRGVFLDQSGPPQWTPPYYSVRVPQSQNIPFHGQSFPWYFQGWEGEQTTFQNPDQAQTAVVFHQANAEARALYKGHLASGNSAATAHNNARRLVRDGAGTLHAVYEDGGSIWYTHSTDNGEHWAAETRIAAPELHRCLYPAIAEYEGALHVVYSDVFYEDENPTAAEIYYLSKPAGGAWQVADGFPGSGIPDPSQIPKPAVAVWRSGSERYAVISYNRFNVYSRITTYYKRAGQGSQFAGEFAGTNPSLGADEPHLDLRLSYEHEGRIYVRAWDTGAKTWYAAEQVSEEPWWLGAQQHSNATYSSDANSHVVWASRDETLMPVVAYRAHRAPGSGTVTYFYAGPWRGAVYPTVAADYGRPISIFYEDEGRIIKRRYDGQYWLEEGFSEGRYPNAAAHGQSGAIWVRDDNAPYRIVPDYTDPWKMRANREDTLLINKRFDYTFVERSSPSEQDTSAGYLTLEIRNLACGERYLQLDSLLRSRPIIIPANASPQYQLLIHFHNLNFPVDSSAALVEAAFEAGPNIHSLGKLRLKQLLPFNNGQAHLLAQTLSAGHLRGKTGRLKFRFENLSPLISNVVVRRPERGIPPLAKPGADSSSTLPTRFELSQNYPNPFNPATTITLSLPQNSKVSFKVYDVTGRLVRTLANQPLPAGVHKISWDGRAEGGEPVSSGVYIYRVVAGGFVESRKMVLLR